MERAQGPDSSALDVIDTQCEKLAEKVDLVTDHVTSTFDVHSLAHYECQLTRMMLKQKILGVIVKVLTSIVAPTHFCIQSNPLPLSESKPLTSITSGMASNAQAECN